MPYENVYEAYEDTYDQTIEDRQSSMDTLEDSYVEHEDITSVSDEMTRLLDPGSEYMTSTVDKTEADMLAAGYAPSQHLKNVGKAAALDNVYKEAMGNVGGYTYEDILLNEKYVQDYSIAYDVILKQQEAGYEGYEQDMEHLYSSEDLTERAEDQKELTEAQSGYELERMALEQQYDLEKKSVQSYYDQKAMESDFGYSMLQTEQAAALDLDQLYYGLANWQLSNNTANQFNLNQAYQKSSQYILASDLEAEDKYDQMASIMGIAQEGIDKAGKWKQLGDNPYSYEDLSMQLPSMADKGDGIYDMGAWYTGGGVSAESMQDFLTSLDRQFRDEMDTKDRHRFKPAEQVDDLLESWPHFQENYPDETKAIEKWFTRIAEEEILQSDDEAYIAVIDTWYNMVRYLPLAEGQTIIPAGPPDPDGESAPASYKDYELIDGDIYAKYYSPVAYYCTQQDVDDYSTGFVRECGIDPLGRGYPSYYEYVVSSTNLTENERDYDAPIVDAGLERVYQ